MINRLNRAIEFIKSINGSYDLRTGEIVAFNKLTLKHEIRHMWQAEESRIFKPLIGLSAFVYENLLILCFGIFAGYFIIGLTLGFDCVAFTLPIGVQYYFVVMGGFYFILEIDAWCYAFKKDKLTS